MQNIFLAGDSTVADCPEHEYPMAGWGQFFQSFFDQDEIKVINKAKGGTSSNSFIEEGRLEEILGEINCGDFLFIQFGHNDQKNYGTEASTTYKQYLTQYVHGAEKRGAIPIFITSVHRRSFEDNGKIKNTLGDYPKAMIELAKSLHVPLIDLWAKTKALYEALGVEGSKELFTWQEPGENPNYPEGIQDNTHFREYGANEIGRLVAESIRELNLPLAEYLK